MGYLVHDCAGWQKCECRDHLAPEEGHPWERVRQGHVLEGQSGRENSRLCEREEIVLIPCQHKSGFKNAHEIQNFISKGIHQGLQRYLIDIYIYIYDDIATRNLCTNLQRVWHCKKSFIIGKNLQHWSLNCAYTIIFFNI